MAYVVRVTVPGLDDEEAAHEFVDTTLLPALRERLPGVDVGIEIEAAPRARRVLVVANHTLGTVALDTCIQGRLELGPCAFHLLAPTEPVLSGGPGDDYGDPALFSPGATARSEEAARSRLYATLDQLHAAGIAASGEVVVEDPVNAVLAAIQRSDIDEIVLSTLPIGASRWLRRDLPSRLQRAVDLPVNVVIGRATD